MGKEDITDEIAEHLAETNSFLAESFELLGHPIKSRRAAERALAHQQVVRKLNAGPQAPTEQDSPLNTTD